MAKADRFLKACKMELPDCTPVWLMRQAGRYMEEYRRLRERHTFKEMCENPELAVEVTLQPVRRFDLDAAIIFSDILLPLEKMGVGLHFSDTEGPALDRPVRSGHDIDALKAIDPEEDLPYVLKAIELARAELGGTVPAHRFFRRPLHPRQLPPGRGRIEILPVDKGVHVYRGKSVRSPHGKAHGHGRGLSERPDQARGPGGPGLRQLGRHSLRHGLRALRHGPHEAPFRVPRQVGPQHPFRRRYLPPAAPDA